MALELEIRAEIGLLELNYQMAELVGQQPFWFNLVILVAKTNFTPALLSFSALYPKNLYLVNPNLLVKERKIDIIFRTQNSFK